MEKRSIVLLLAFFSLFSALQAQIEIDEEKDDNESTTQGFFVKKGQMRIEALECYDFEDLIISFNIKKEHFACDRISIVLQLGNPEKKNSIKEYIYTVDREDFKVLFEDKDYAYFKIFSSPDLDEKSDWKWKDEYNRRIPLQRIDLQYALKKPEVETFKIVALIRCGNIKGVKTVHETKSDGSIVSRDIENWDWSTSTALELDLKNRIFVSYVDAFKNKHKKVTTTDQGCYK